MDERRPQEVVAAEYDRMAERYAEWQTRIVGDPRDRYVDCSPPRRVSLRELERAPMAVRVRGDRCLEDKTACPYLNHRQRVHITMRVDADDVVQLICKHPDRSSDLVRWVR